MTIKRIASCNHCDDTTPQSFIINKVNHIGYILMLFILVPVIGAVLAGMGIMSGVAPIAIIFSGILPILVMVNWWRDYGDYCSNKSGTWYCDHCGQPSGDYIVPATKANKDKINTSTGANIGQQLRDAVTLARSKNIQIPMHVMSTYEALINSRPIDQQLVKAAHEELTQLIEA